MVSPTKKDRLPLHDTASSEAGPAGLTEVWESTKSCKSMLILESYPELDLHTTCMPRPTPRWRDSSEWCVISKCLRRIRRWRVPPRWSDRDWHEEMEAEASAAALQAKRDFDPTRGVPWEAFLYQRIVHSALARHRREWTFAIRRVSIKAWDEYEMTEGGSLPSREATHELLHDALGRLSAADARLIEGLFWEGKTEAGLGEDLEISQQAVSKRKRSILKTLRRVVEMIAKGRELCL